MNSFTRTVVAGIGLLAFLGGAAGGAQAAPKPPEGKLYVVKGVSNCTEAVKKSVRKFGTPKNMNQYSCLMRADNNSADLIWHKA